jgi:hypothetical protein
LRVEGEVRELAVRLEPSKLWKPLGHEMKAAGVTRALDDGR